MQHIIDLCLQRFYKHHNPWEGIKVNSLVKNRRNFGETRSHRPWSNLPADVLGEIMQLLSLADQIRLCCVCKSFLELPLHHDRLVDRLPWLVTCDNSESDGFVCKLFDPMHKKPYEIDRITGPGMDSFCPDYATSKAGWLFFLREKGRFTAELFLFCPYTKEIIGLPDLHHGCGCGCRKDVDCYTCSRIRRRILTFSSSDPKSQDCIFFAVYYLWDNDDNGEITICSYRQKDRGWRTREESYEMPYIKITNLIYSEGYLHCINTDGYLGIYDVQYQDWSTFRVPGRKVANNYGQFHLVDAEGTLLLAILENFFDSSRCKLYRLDESSSNTDQWVRLKVLENQALFLGHHPWDCTILVRMLTGDLEFVGNKIFYRGVDERVCWGFYAFNGSEHHSCHGTEFEYFVPREEEKHQENEDPNGRPGMRRDPAALWIEPPNNVLKPFHSRDSRDWE